MEIKNKKMEKKIEWHIVFDNNGEKKQGVVIDARGKDLIVLSESMEYVVSTHHILRVASDKSNLDLEKDIETIDENMSNSESVNAIEFFRYYPLSGEPFKISYDPTNKYGAGIYFLDNPEFYHGKFEKSRLMKVKPNVKAPLILTYHKRLTPSFEYSELLNNLMDKGEVNGKDELTHKLIQSGFDSVVVYEPRGIYLILLKEDESLVEVISDLGVSPETKLINEVDSNELDFDIRIEIAEIVSNDYNDIHGYQGEILYRNFFDDMDGFFIPSKSDAEYVADLVTKDYLQRDYEIFGEAYILADTGRSFVEDVLSATM